MTPEIINRKGARKAQDIPQEVLNLLNEGKIETVNLTEWLAINHIQLIEVVFPELGFSQPNIDFIIQEVRAQKKPSTMNTTKLVGTTLYQLYANAEDYSKCLHQLSNHLSDSIRCYAPYLIGFK